MGDVEPGGCIQFYSDGLRAVDVQQHSPQPGAPQSSQAGVEQDTPQPVTLGAGVDPDHVHLAEVGVMPLRPMEARKHLKIHLHLNAGAPTIGQ